ncbi:hypothetical protein DVH24_015521, partial [Malus domestica]
PSPDCTQPASSSSSLPSSPVAFLLDFRSASKPQQLSHDDEDSDSECFEIKHELEDDDSDCIVINKALEDDDSDCRDFSFVDLKKLLTGEDRDLIGGMKSILGPFILRRLKSEVMQQLHELVLQKLQRLTRTVFLRFFLGGRSPTILFSFVRCVCLDFNVFDIPLLCSDCIYVCLLFFLFSFSRLQIILY